MDLIEYSFDLNRYKLGISLGKGSFGEVFEAKDTKTGDIYAAKISLALYFEDQINEKEVLNIIREVNIMSKIQHPSIIKFIGFSPIDFDGNFRPVLITEYMPHGSLKDIIEKERSGNSDPRWDFTQKLITLYGISAAMSFLHSNNTIHRDLKLDNILMDSELFPKVTDFGLSKILHFNSDSMTMESTDGFKGTLLYSPPEELAEYEFTKAGDVYSFAMIAYELFTLEIPFSECKNANSLIQKVMNSIRPSFNSTVPQCYQSLIERCWSQEPKDRPTFDEIISMLKDDADFITDLVDEVRYLNYVDFIDESIISFKKGQSILSFEQFVKKKNSTKSDLNEVHDDKKSKYNYLKKEADKGNVNSMFIYASCIFDEDKEEAAKYFKQAADKGHTESNACYAEFLNNGIGIKADKKEAFKYYKVAALKGHVPSMYNYALFLYHGWETEIDHKEAFKYFKKAMEGGQIEATYNYAVMLLKGQGVAENKEEALKYYKIGADKGFIESMFSYAFMMSNGIDCPVNFKEAAKYYKKAADLGHLESMRNLGILLQNGDGIPADEKEAARYFKEAADAGHTKSMIDYAFALQTGNGVQADLAKAALYYKNAADKGSVIGMINYASLLLNGNEIQVNYEEGTRYLKMAEDAGNTDAMKFYATMVREGIGVHKNEDEAIKYEKMANSFNKQ